jgi:hypothetical protein
MLAVPAHVRRRPAAAALVPHGHVHGDGLDLVVAAHRDALWHCLHRSSTVATGTGNDDGLGQNVGEIGRQLHHEIQLFQPICLAGFELLDPPPQALNLFSVILPEELRLLNVIQFFLEFEDEIRKAVFRYCRRRSHSSARTAFTCSSCRSVICS